MKIIQLHIYGYGKLINKVYSFEDFQLIYGENEAGKSTIMSFIHSILFGFPTRQQTGLRYEPKGSSEYGGKILCETEKYGKVSIERVKGKAAGDVSIRLDDGRTGGEEILSELMGNMDKSTYQNIFSFNLDGLQDIHKLKKAELNRYLFSAGSTGTDLLLQMEQQWQKEREQLFKKSGRKPVINTKLNELKALEKQVGEAREKNKQYGPLLKEKQLLEAAISSLEEERECLTQEKDGLHVIDEHWDRLTEYVSTSIKLSALEEISIPPKGAERLNGLKVEWRQASSYMETLDTRHRKLEEKLEAVQLPSQFSSQIHHVETLVSQQPIFMKWMDDLSDISREMKAEKNRVSHTMRELDLRITEKDIPSINTSLLMSERIEQVLQEKNKLENEHKNLMKQVESEFHAMQRIERKMGDLEELLLKEEEYQALQRKVKQQTSQHASLQQKVWVENQLDEAEKDVEGRRKSFSNQILYSGMAALSLAVFAIWAFMNDNATGALLGFLIIAILAVNGWKSRQYVNEKVNRLQSLKGKVREFSEGVELEGDAASIAASERLFREQMEYRSEWKQRILQLEEQEAKVDKVRRLQEETESKLTVEHKTLEEIKEELHLPSEFPWKWLRDAFGKIKELVQSYERLQQLREDEKFLQEKIDGFSKDCEEWFMRHSYVFTTMQEAFIKMKNILQDVEKKKLTFEQLQADIESLRLEREQSALHLKKINDEIQSLIKEAGCKDEEEFREQSLRAEERKDLLARYEGMKTRVNQLTLDLFSTFEFKEDVTNRLREIVLRSSELIKDLSHRQKKLASVEHEIKLLEEGAGYSKLLQEFQERKADLQEYILKWSKYTLAQDSLNKTIHHYQQTKMPNVIKLAEEYFAILTREFYQSIYVTENEMIEVERKDGHRFQAVELSQGTKEQLYIAIRFALVQSLKDIYKLPLLIDDGAVNFDWERTGAFVELLRKMGREHQIILFTCHPHIKHYFEEREAIVLEKSVPV
ncbi:AAA family ATPase [Bacillus sp. Marseille-Q1617]|uniref:ATP-binding protein n=1 Tax=Bacillus sp. Marseille-Q1617 TaxID=2736887 RepID=UPI00158A0411|nr:AAA family ATPase [Bacillus sp. Marseille-Q1617]